jgi:phosphoribosyl 1,2-cyclic phosphate phosphodiesterase
MSFALTILGCGSSGGVPRVGSGWGKCDPDEPRNRRRRCSVLVERQVADAASTVLVDTSPDLRDQLLTAGVRRLDAVLYTHEHADHTHGIDDLRALVIHMRRQMDAWLDETTSGVMRMRFSYIFETPEGSDYPPILVERRLHHGKAIQLGSEDAPITAVPFRLEHGNGDALGFRFGKFAYAPDVSEVPPESMRFFEGLDVLVVDALRDTPHPTHFNVAQALELIERVRPRHAVLTNLHTDLDYRELASRLPAGVEPAYDGMRISIPD